MITQNLTLFLIGALIIFVWGVGSLLLIAIKTNSLKSIFFKNPSILVGDFLLIPLIGGLITSSLKKDSEFLSNPFLLISLISAGILTLASAWRNQLVNILWITHLAFYFTMAFLILSFLLINFGKDYITWWIVLSGVAIHQTLGVIYKKSFPKI